MMSFVEIYKLEPNGTQTVMAVCSLQNTEVVCEGDDAFVRMLKQEGIRDYESKDFKQLFPKDGLRFLEQLKFAFRSGYLNASEVKQREE